MFEPLPEPKTAAELKQRYADVRRRLYPRPAPMLRPLIVEPELEPEPDSAPEPAPQLTDADWAAMIQLPEAEAEGPEATEPAWYDDLEGVQKQIGQAIAIYRDLVRRKLGTNPALLMKRAAAKAFNVSVRDLEGPSRAHPIVRLRQYAMALTDRLTCPKASLPGIGRAYNRDHTTVLSGIRRVGQFVDEVIAAEPSAPAAEESVLAHG